jgi:hypothetical protein
MSRPLQVYLDEESANFQRYLDETFVAEPSTPNRARRRRSGPTVRR